VDKSSHPGGFFAAQALCAANQVKPKARSFCHRTARLVLPDFARSCPYDGLSTEPRFRIMKNAKEAQRPVRARGRESGLSGGSDRPDLIFLVTFCIKWLLHN